MSRGFTVLILVISITVSAAPQQQSSSFKSGSTMVPLNIRVLDRTGRPVEGLKSSDFTVKEDGVVQQLTHFSFERVQPDTTASDALFVRQAPSERVTAQQRRTFLFVFGRGRQVGPVRGVEGAMRFIKEQLLPQDQVAVLAYNRSTKFTTDHTRVLATLKRYWGKHEWIETRLSHHFSGLAAIYGAPEIPPFIQREIDTIFEESHAVTPNATSKNAPLGQDGRRDRDRIQAAELASARLNAGAGTTFDRSTVRDAEPLEIGFDEYVNGSIEATSDLDSLYAGIRYLSMADGEKHLVLLTPQGLLLPRLESSDSIAALANDARVTIDVLHTYGLSGAGFTSSLGGPSRATTRQAHGGFRQFFQAGTSERLAQLTGGQMMQYREGARFFQKLDEATRAYYLVGYVPTNPKWDGKFRRIQVEVNRKGLKVLHRHGYYGRIQRAPLAPREYLAYNRIAAAANTARPLTGIDIELRDLAWATSNGNRMVTATLRIAPGALTLTASGENRRAKIEVAAFCADGDEIVIGELWHTVELDLTPENHRRLTTEGLAVTLRVPVSKRPRYLKAIVYDHTADNVGSVMSKIES